MGWIVVSDGIDLETEGEQSVHAGMPSSFAPEKNSSLSCLLDQVEKRKAKPAPTAPIT